MKVTMMNAKTAQPTHPDDEDMPAEIDFSKGTRGKFYRAGARFILPVHMAAEVANDLTRSAEQEGIDVTAFVAKLLDEHRLAANNAPARARP
jgi:hypothetical protein